MPILTRVIAVTILVARRAEKNFTAEFFGTAGLDLLHDRAVARRHARAVLLQVGGAVLAEDVREFEPMLVVALQALHELVDHVFGLLERLFG